jgi:hypothetical protein
MSSIDQEFLGELQELFEAARTLVAASLTDSKIEAVIKVDRLAIEANEDATGWSSRWFLSSVRRRGLCSRRSGRGSLGRLGR